MALDLVDYEKKTQKAVKSFWKTRNAAKKKKRTSGKSDQGERGSSRTPLIWKDMICSAKSSCENNFIRRLP